LHGGAAERGAVALAQGAAVAGAVVLLLVLAEVVRRAGAHAWGDFLDVARLAVYWGWLRFAWTEAGLARRAALAALLVLMVLI
jgi:hypothetical protein